MIITAQFDLDKIKIDLKEFSNNILKFADHYWIKDTQYTPYTPYPSHIRDITQGWKIIGNVVNWKSAHGPEVPGTYALVLDLDDSATNPIFSKFTICFGETTQPGHKRIIHHVGALKGKTSNMSDKYRKHIPYINRAFNTDITKNIDKIKIFFREHRITDEDWETSREHSVYMEQLCHAAYKILHGRFAPGNTRDLASDYLIERTNKELFKKDSNESKELA